MARAALSRVVSATALAALTFALLPASSALAAEPRDFSEFACPIADVPDPGFVDDDETVHREAIACIVFYEIAQGTAENRYSPGEVVNRARMATFIRNVLVAAGVELHQDPPNAFTDDEGIHHEHAINQLAAVGVVAGRGGGRYAPASPVGRGQMATFLNNAHEAVTGARLASSQDHFTDDNGTQHEESINAVAEAGIAAGTSETTYAPNRPVSRAQMASFLARQTDLLVEQGFVEVPRGGVNNPTALNVPELLRVEEASDTQVRFVFDEALGSTVVASAFALYDVAADRVEATDATREGEAAVLVTFDASVVDQATLAGVAAGGVQDADGNLSPEGAAGLQDVGFATGTTATPDLVAVEVGQNAAAFTFDEAAFTRGNQGYHVVLADGTVKTATDAEPSGNGTTTHTVAFEQLTAAEADLVAYGYVDAGTVADAEQDGNANVLQTTRVSASGTTELPDLLSVSIDGDTATYTFDEYVERSIGGGVGGVGEGPQGAFQLYTVDGSVLTAESAQKGDNRSFVATFAEGSVTELVSGASVLADTVVAEDGDVNQPGQVGFPVEFLAGDTAAPELVAAEVTEDAESTDRTVTFSFDASVGEVLDETQLKVYARDGSSASFVAAGSFPPTTSDCALDSEDDSLVVCVVVEDEEPELWAFLADARLATAERGTVTSDGGYANAEGAAVLQGSVENPPPPEEQPSAA